MTEYDLHLRVKNFPPVFRREKHVLVLIQNRDQQFILATKDVYPKGISRMIGGGMDEGETPAQAAARELAEETGLVAKPKDLIHLAEVRAHVTDATDEALTFVTSVFLYHLGDQTIQPQDDIKGIETLNEAQYYDLLHKYETLPSTIDEKLLFSWYDYGQLYGFIHRLAINEVRRHT